DPSFFSAVKIAALSGIDVRIMVPGEWDKFYVKAAAFQFIRDMIPLGITFYKYPGFIHAKAIVVDGKVLTIGSCNIDCRSFELHYETNVFFYNEAFAKKYEKIFLADQSKCRQYEAQWFESRNIFQKAWWGFCRLFSPIM
ncbi:MAG: phospholipase D-like domain-containing protein, partial [Spirochaetales bacterium]